MANSPHQYDKAPGKVGDGGGEETPEPASEVLHPSNTSLIHNGKGYMFGLQEGNFFSHYQTHHVRDAVI